ncbi:MAG: phytanoyl-CoA dioxygenase family protein, partial [Cyanobacteria bacterium MAG COS4_bin_21]|nr:phytanoyl-CoA dioxygenase family protein [Cyanobacteria bacterium MAG COS4_bin_21]
LRDEVETVVARASRLHPAPDNSRPGFRPKQPFPGGFDRFDGGTLNRFLHIDPEQMPRAAAFSHDQRLSAGSRQVIGLPMNPRKLDIYLTVHGEEASTPDLQKVLHRDTFFRALKFWFFLRPVQPQDGPFEYVPGSHRLDPSRLRWEQATATAAAEHRRQPDVSGSFRIQEESLAELGLPRPVALTCPANTLVLADVFGFHRRGAAAQGQQRLALYGWNRPYPFLPISW